MRPIMELGIGVWISGQASLAREVRTGVGMRGAGSRSSGEAPARVMSKISPKTQFLEFPSECIRLHSQLDGEIHPLTRQPTP
jgi:hypothetical protein